MRNYAKLFSFYTSDFARISRIILFGFFIFLCLYLFLHNPNYLKVPLFVLGILIMAEVFLRFRIYRKNPDILILKNNGKNIYSSFTLTALRILDENGIILENAFSEKPVKFMLEKAEIKEEDVKKISIKMDDLTRYAFELVKNINGEYVTVLDVFAS